MSFKPAWKVVAPILAFLPSIVQVSFADSLTSPFGLELSSQSAQTLLGGIEQFKSPSGEFKTDLPNQTLTSPYAVSISGIHLTLDYTFNTPTVGASLSQWSIQSSNISAEIVVDSINASQTVVEQSGGSSLTLQLAATCTDIHLQLAPGSTQMSAKVDLSLAGAKPTFSLTDFSASWTPSAWQITSMTCQGPDGFYQLVQQDAATQLQSINPFLPAIESQIQAQIAAASSSQISWTLQAQGNSGVSITLQPESITFLSGGGASLNGMVAFGFSKLKDSPCQSTIETLPAAPTHIDSLVIPISAAERLVQCAYMNGSVEASFTSKQFPAFQSLLAGWFSKLFVWPDLERFNSSSIFDFQFFPTGTPVFGAMSTDSSGDFLFNLAVPLTLSVYAPQGSSHEHYLDFSTQVSGPATLSVQNGVLAFKENSKQLNLTAFWDSLYVQTYKPDQDIWTSVIAGDLKKYLAQTGVTYTLPVWQAPGAFSMSIENAVADGTSVNISLGIKTLSPSTQ